MVIGVPQYLAIVATAWPAPGSELQPGMLMHFRLTVASILDRLDSQKDTSWPCGWPQRPRVRNPGTMSEASHHLPF